MDRKIKMRYEVSWDYDVILYHEYEDWQLFNIHCNVEFDKWKQRTEFTPLYQFKNSKLVAYSTAKAEGLTIDDDLNLPKNLLWWTRGINGNQELIFRPLKDLDVAHLKEIIKWRHTQNDEYVSAILEILSSIITIKQWASPSDT